MKQVKRIETNYKEQRYWQETAIEAAECTDCMNLVQLFPQIREQTMEGFGGAFTESSAVNYHRLGKEQKKELIGRADLTVTGGLPTPVPNGRYTRCMCLCLRCCVTIPVAGCAGIVI